MFAAIFARNASQDLFKWPLFAQAVLWLRSHVCNWGGCGSGGRAGCSHMVGLPGPPHTLVWSTAPPPWCVFVSSQTESTCFLFLDR